MAFGISTAKKTSQLKTEGFFPMDLNEKETRLHEFHYVQKSYLQEIML